MVDDKQTVLFKVSIFAAAALVFTFSTLTNIPAQPQNLTFSQVSAPKMIDTQTRKALEHWVTFKMPTLSDTTAQCFRPDHDAQQVASTDDHSLVN